MSYTEETKILLEKSKRKLGRAKEALSIEDYDSALGDAYRCVELTMRASLVARGITRLPETWRTATTPCAKLSRDKGFSKGTGEEDKTKFMYL